MPRSVSSVTTWAAFQWTPSAPTGASQTLSTPSWGAIHAKLVPLGEMRGLTRSGFPNRTCRGMSSAMRLANPCRGVLPSAMPTTANAVTSTIPKVTGSATRPPGARGALVIWGGYVIMLDPATGDLPSADVLVSEVRSLRWAVAHRAARLPRAGRTRHGTDTWPCGYTLAYVEHPAPRPVRERAGLLPAGRAAWPRVRRR